MNSQPLSEEKIKEIISKFPTPIYVYDEKGILDSANQLNDMYSWSPGYKNFYASKALPNPHIHKLLKEKAGMGIDVSSLAELVLAEKVGFKGEEIIFSSNDTPADEFQKATDLGAIINFDDINSEKSYQGFKAYAQSKLANLMFALELQKRIEKDSRKILSLAAHPGYASTNLFSAGGGRFGSAKIFSRIFAQPASQGVLPILRAALDKAAQGGEFYGPSFFGMRGSPVKVTIFENALNTKVSKKLWEVSEELTSTNSLKLD